MENKRFCDYANVEPTQFEFTYYEQGERCTAIFDSTDRIGDNPYEWTNSVVEIIDDVLSLKEGETMWLCAIRDDKQSKGILCRIK